MSGAPPGDALLGREQEVRRPRVARAQTRRGSPPPTARWTPRRRTRLSVWCGDLWLCQSAGAIWIVQQAVYRLPATPFRSGEEEGLARHGHEALRVDVDDAEGRESPQPDPARQARHVNERPQRLARRGGDLARHEEAGARTSPASFSSRSRTPPPRKPAAPSQPARSATTGSPGRAAARALPRGQQSLQSHAAGTSIANARRQRRRARLDQPQEPARAPRPWRRLQRERLRIDANHPACRPHGRHIDCGRPRPRRAAARHDEGDDGERREDDRRLCHGERAVVRKRGGACQCFTDLHSRMEGSRHHRGFVARRHLVSRSAARHRSTGRSTSNSLSRPFKQPVCRRTNSLSRHLSTVVCHQQTACVLAGPDFTNAGRWTHKAADHKWLTCSLDGLSPPFPQPETPAGRMNTL